VTCFFTEDRCNVLFVEVDVTCFSQRTGRMICLHCDG
jgi:hypothetical protein